MARRSKFGDTPLAGKQEEVQAFGEGQLFESERAKETAENRFGFAEQDLDQFGARLQTKAEREFKNLNDEEEEEKSFITCKCNIYMFIETDYKEEALN